MHVSQLAMAMRTRRLAMPRLPITSRITSRVNCSPWTGLPGARNGVPWCRVCSLEAGSETESSNCYSGECVKSSMVGMEVESKE